MFDEIKNGDSYGELKSNKIKSMIDEYNTLSFQRNRKKKKDLEKTLQQEIQIHLEKKPQKEATFIGNLRYFSVANHEILMLKRS